MSDVTEFNVETQEETIREFNENESIGIEVIKEQSKVIAGS